ncbi:hypothetical protein MOQ_005842 [Trypanosoma cruzi marinkellei]|uniref:Uncharacterized protein n=1 Tax=Trypanosoma cruzi marinkellei TaxID=85056 RepID=K2M600_TRYCR|nr:hypothetical protein MOQ_005842 [Trypanosoma cruzi marinkellei]
MLDTDNDVRRAALATLETILHPSPSLRDRGLQEDNMSLNESTVLASGGVTFDMDRTRAVLRIVDVTLTHAMTSVRRSGIELLHIILRVSPHDVRAVLRESDAWVKMVSRVSSVLLQGTSGSGAGTKTMGMTHLVPDLLETMLLQCDGVRNDGGFSGGFQQAEEDVGAGATPERILELFEECTPKWSMEWKELMEMRTAIFRDAERVQRATAIARAFAYLTMYLRGRSLLNKSHKQLIRHLFTVKMPFTIHELIPATAAASGHGGDNGNCNTRMELANAIADACLPVADSAGDACQLLRDFLSAALRAANGASSSSSSSALRPQGGGEGRMATQLLGPLRTLRTAFVRFPTSLLPRLLFLAPPMMRAVMRAACSTDSLKWGEASLLAADVLSVLLASQTAASLKSGLRFLSDAVLMVPRLLFSLRGKAESATLDRAVYAFLQPLWRVASGGHPLLQCPATSTDDAATQLRLSLPSLFELRVPDDEAPGAYVTLDGVLSRCTERTRELGAHLLFYLCGEAPCTGVAPPTHTTLASTLPQR